MGRRGRGLKSERCCARVPRAPRGGERRGGGACQAVLYPLDGDRARRALTLCQERFQRFARHFSFELASYERIEDLRTVGEERGEDWLYWAGVVKRALEQSREQVEEVREKLFVCWQELAERIATTSVSIQNTTIGHVSAARLRNKAAAEKGGS